MQAHQSPADVKAISPVVELQKIIEGTTETRYDIFPYTHDDFWFPQFTRCILRELAGGDVKLFYRGRRIKKLQLFMHTESPVIGKITSYCLEISTDNREKCMVSLDNDFGLKLRDLFMEMNAEIDDCLMSSGHFGASFWGQPYGVSAWGSAAASDYPFIHKFMLGQLMTLLQREPIASVILLEYGCGYANLLSMCVEKCQEVGVKVEQAIGTDYCDEAITHAVAKHGKKSNLFRFFIVDSRQLATKLNSELKPHRQEKTKVIALSSGAMNQKVLQSDGEALDILNNLYQLEVDYILTSGETHIAFNNTIAKRGGYKRVERLESTANKKVFDSFLWKKMNGEEMKKYQEKFKSQVDPRGWPMHYVQLGMTPKLTQRLFPTVKTPFPTTIQDEKQFQDKLKEIPKQSPPANVIVWRESPIVKEMNEWHDALKKGILSYEEYIDIVHFSLNQIHRVYLNADAKLAHSWDTVVYRERSAAREQLLTRLLLFNQQRLTYANTRAASENNSSAALTPAAR